MLLRDREPFDVLLLRRNSKLAFHGGAWVFPGGRIDAGDWSDGDEILEAARRAAAREAREEAGVEIDPASLVPFARWTTPERMPRRFLTWFFALVVDDLVVNVDGEEIHDHRWLCPAEALAAQGAGEIELPPPTFVTLTRLAEHESAGAALSALSEGGPEIFTPRFERVPGGACALYEADAGYDDGDVDASGPRHRVWMLESGWRYERELD